MNDFPMGVFELICFYCNIDELAILETIYPLSIRDYVVKKSLDNIESFSSFSRLLAHYEQQMKFFAHMKQEID